MNGKKRSLRILQICNKPPFPPKDGGAIGINNVTHGLIQAGHFVKVISLNTPKHFVDILDLPDKYVAETGIEFFFIDTDIKILDALLNLFSNKSYNIARFYSHDFEIFLENHLKLNQYDIIQIETIFLHHYINKLRKVSSAKIILRAPNVEFQIWNRLAEIEKNIFKKYYLKILATRLKNEEIGCLNKFDGIYTVTENDLNEFIVNGVNVPITFVPTGIDVTKSVKKVSNEINNPTLFHIGALDWMPNQEGILWFLHNVWPQLKILFPNLRFNIAGRRPPKWFFDLSGNGINIIGEIEDANQFIEENSIMVVPLFSGSGMRVKIVEGMVMGKVVISTSIGVEGIICSHGQDYILANTPHEFIESITSLLLDKNLYNKISNNATTNSVINYSNINLTSKIVDFFNKILD